MAVLRFWNGASWYPLYIDVFSKCLHKANNLGDITDVAAARANLELTGNNVATHLHDARYLPLISTETENRTLADNVEIQARAAADEYLQEQINNLGIALAALQNGVAILSGNITVGKTAPASASNDASVWFDTTSKLIKVYHGGTWVPMSAVWL